MHFAIVLLLWSTANSPGYCDPAENAPRVFRTQIKGGTGALPYPTQPQAPARYVPPDHRTQPVQEAPSIPTALQPLQEPTSLGSGNREPDTIRDKMENTFWDVKGAVLNATQAAEGAVIHPFDTVKALVQHALKTANGLTLAHNIASQDPSVDLDNRKQRFTPQLLGNEATTLFGESPFPPRVNTLEGYPDPLTDPLACHRRGVKKAYVCDPDDILGPQKANVIENVLTNMRATCSHPCGVSFAGEDLEEPTGALGRKSGLIVDTTPCEVAVAVMGDLPKDVSGDRMAETLLDRYHIGREDCQDGVIVVYVEAERQAYIKWRPGEEERLNVEMYEASRPILAAAFSSSSIDEGIMEALALIKMQQEGKFDMPRRKAQFVVLVSIATSTGLFFSCCFIQNILTLYNDENQPKTDVSPPLLVSEAEK